MDKKTIKKSKKAVRHHLNNMKYLEKNPNPSDEELEKMYGYLDYCWICNKKFTFWDRLTFNMVHSFEGNSHRRNCDG